MPGPGASTASKTSKSGRRFANRGRSAVERGSKAASRGSKAAGDQLKNVAEKATELRKQIKGIEGQQKEWRKKLTEAKGDPTKNKAEIQKINQKLQGVNKALKGKKAELRKLESRADEGTGTLSKKYNRSGEKGLSPSSLADEVGAVATKGDAAIKKGTLKNSGFFKKAFYTFLGYNVLVAGLLDSEEECKEACEARTSPGKVEGGVLSKATSSKCDTLLDSNCPDETADDDCSAYCDKACGEDQRIRRAQCQFASNPMGAAMAALPNMAKTPLSIWDNFKYFIVGIPLFIIFLISLPLIKGMFTGAEMAASAVGTSIGTSAVQKLGPKGGWRKRGGK